MILGAAAEEAVRFPPHNYALSAFGEGPALEAAKAEAAKKLAQVRGIVAKAKGVIGKHNEIMHATWGLSATTEDVHRVVSQEALTGPGTPVTLEELQTFLRDIRRVIDAVADYTCDEL